MAAYPSLNLPRFSGSTLEPTVEPLAFVPTSLSHLSASASSSSILLSPALSSTDSSSVGDDDDYLLLAPSFSLNRPNRPTFIDIPSTCRNFTIQDANECQDWSSYDPQERGCQTQPEFEWDESEQTVYKRSSNHHRHPDPSRHIFWSA
ncbi:hypothetical protein BCR42DRAFT_409183 [Absidia repens]|uniref:Uncharacterized protein n=1 Tax=Absidia repens TaxID=90262 RepID=A0A1X2IQV8_9FUNG|nr:hypothetical protein BCR42DRAFT_409183 [Absidia repens]